MKLARIAAPLLAVTLLATTGAFAQQYGGPPPPPPPQEGYGQGPGYGPGPQGPGGWNTPPGEYREFQQRGFRDGIEGARRDFQNRRPFTPENRDEYRHPNVPRNVYHDYRQAFREGYHRAVVNMHYGYGPGYGPGPR